MNCIIIDDDNVSRLLIEKYVAKTESLELVGSFNNAINAINLLQASDNDVDLIFLDIEMPEMTGVELLKSVDELPQVIVISAKEKYALEAIEYDITDYLLKPVAYARFFKAVEKAMKRYKIVSTEDETDGVFIKNNSSSLVRLKYEEILWIEALENYVVINTFDNKYTIHFTMKAIVNKLPAKHFIRIHRSYIVNISKIESIEDNSINIKTKEGIKMIPIAKSYRESLMKNINIMTK